MKPAAVTLKVSTPANNVYSGGKFTGETTQKSYFNEKTPVKEPPGKALEAKNDLRKAHFAFGSSSLAAGEPFTTTNQEKQRLVTAES